MTCVESFSEMCFKRRYGWGVGRWVGSHLLSSSVPLPLGRWIIWFCRLRALSGYEKISNGGSYEARFSTMFIFYLFYPINGFFFFFGQMHIVCKRKDLTLDKALQEHDGLAVLGFFIEVKSTAKHWPMISFGHEMGPLWDILSGPINICLHWFIAY